MFMRLQSSIGANLWLNASGICSTVSGAPRYCLLSSLLPRFTLPPVSAPSQPLRHRQQEHPQQPQQYSNNAGIQRSVTFTTECQPEPQSCCSPIATTIPHAGRPRHSLYPQHAQACCATVRPHSTYSLSVKLTSLQPEHSDQIGPPSSSIPTRPQTERQPLQVQDLRLPTLAGSPSFVRLFAIYILYVELT